MQLKLLVRHPVYWQKAKQILRQKHDLTSGEGALPQRTIVLDLYTCDLLFDCGRHLFTLAHYARLAGSPLMIRCSRVMLSGIVKKGFGRQAIAMSHVGWVPPHASLPANAFVLVDTSWRSTSRPRTNHPPVQMLIGRDRPAIYPVMPYPMHPGTLPHADDGELSRCRRQKRSGVLFAGRLQARYGRHGVSQKFRITSRLEIVETLAQIAHSNPLVTIRDSDVEPIESHDWLSYLGNHDFFVCAPGVAQPLCHNVVEAMSVGTIPIIEYGNRLTPALIDGQHALCFHGRGGFLRVIEKASRMSEVEKRKMRQRVIEYFESHLRCEKFLANLRDMVSDTAPTKVVMPFHSENFFIRQSKAA